MTGALDVLFRTELKAFLSHIGKQPVPEAQDLRAGVLGFLATFAPESLSDTATELLSETITQLHASPSYSTFEWFRIPYLDAARANLFDDPAALEMVVRNLGHGSRMIRLYLYAPLGLAIRRLDLNRCGFSEAMQRNYEIGHLGNDAGICLLLASRLTESEKRGMLETWHDRAANVEDKIILSETLKGEPVRNDMIFDEYFNISLALFRALLSLPSQQGDVEGGLNLLSVEPDEIVKRIRAHPLCASTLRVL